MPHGLSWPLPLYELALLTAVHLADAGALGVKIDVVTPEPQPLQLFGPEASEAIIDLLDLHGMDLHTETVPLGAADGVLRFAGGRELEADRVVALPRLEGPRLTGLPQDAAGFIPVDEHQAVRGWYDVYADLNVNANHSSKEPGFQVIVGTVSYAAPGKAFYHSDKPIKKAGGVYADALKGTRDAAARGYTWIDQDGQLAYKTNARLRAGVARVSQASDLVWVNAHGAPFNPKWLKRKKNKKRFEDHPWSSLKKHAGLRDVDKTFRQNAAYHLSVEWEVKDVHPFSRAAALDAAFTNLATAAQTYYGAGWADRVQVKVLSNLHGGQKYALKVLKHAHAHGFTTIYLARGQATHAQIPASKQQYVTYVRGAQAGYYPAIPVPGQSVVVP